MEQKLYKLIIDDEYKNLIRPLLPAEFRQLEENILADGCRDPLTVWDGVIIDGHNRYAICTRHRIPFSIVEKSFSCKEEAIAWICANQLGRRNLTEEVRKFLIGKQYESLKIANSRKNALGINQHTEFDDDESIPDGATPRFRTSLKIAADNHISHGTVEKYAQYSRAIDRIREKEPRLVPQILSGQCKATHESVLELAELPVNGLRRISRRIDEAPPNTMTFKQMRKEVQTVSLDSRSSKTQPDYKLQTQIKEMPSFDPDAELTGLILTIPSWTGSIERVLTKSDPSVASSAAKTKLMMALNSLSQSMEKIMNAIQEDI